MQRNDCNPFSPSIAGIFLEPLDWALTAREIYNEPSNPWSYVGAIPIVPSAVGKAGKVLGKAGKHVDEAAEACSSLSLNPGASSANAATALRKKLSALEEAQKSAVRTRSLLDGRVRYYEPEKLARTPGPTRGAAFVTEWDPKSGTVRQWMESHDHAGNVVRVHPKTLNVSCFR